MGRQQQEIKSDFKHKEAIAKMLRHERSIRGLTGREMADFLGVPRHTYPKYETGRSFPAYKHLTTILLKLNKEIIFNNVELSDKIKNLNNHILPTGNTNGPLFATNNITKGN